MMRSLFASLILLTAGSWAGAAQPPREGWHYGIVVSFIVGGERARDFRFMFPGRDDCEAYAIIMKRKFALPRAPACRVFIEPSERER